MELRVGLAVSLSGGLAPMGRDAHRGLALWAEEVGATLVVRDDGSNPARLKSAVAALLDEERVDLLAGPYSSGLTRAAAPLAEARGVVLWNHGGAADDIHERGQQLIVGILTPASRYMEPVLRWARDGEVMVLYRPSSGFSTRIAAGAEAIARLQRRPVRRQPYPVNRPALEALVDRIAAAPPGLLVGAGRLEDDVALALAVNRIRLRIPTALVAAGVRTFGECLGESADRFVGPSQWESGAPVTPALGPTPQQFATRFRERFGVTPDYPAAQAYAAGLLMALCIERAGGKDPAALRSVAATLDITTLFGRFRIEPQTGLQLGHDMLLVEWVGGERRIITVADKN